MCAYKQHSITTTTQTHYKELRTTRASKPHSFSDAVFHSLTLTHLVIYNVLMTTNAIFVPFRVLSTQNTQDA